MQSRERPTVRILLAAAGAMALVACGGGPLDLGQQDDSLTQLASPAASNGHPGLPQALHRPDLAGALEQLRSPKASSTGCDPARAPRATVFTSIKPGSGSSTSADPRYSIYSTTSVFVVAFVENLCGEHVARFEVFAPDGDRYMARQVSFNTDSEQPGVLAVPGGYLVGIPFRISGTEVSSRPIIGVWSVNFFVETAQSAKAVGLFETTS